MPIEDFSISQTSLDDVFISFATTTEPEGRVEGKTSISAIENGCLNGVNRNHLRTTPGVDLVENTAL